MLASIGHGWSMHTKSATVWIKVVWAEGIPSAVWIYAAFFTTFSRCIGKIVVTWFIAVFPPDQGFPHLPDFLVCGAGRRTDPFWLAVSLIHEWKSVMQTFCCTIQPRFQRHNCCTGRKVANILQVGLYRYTYSSSGVTDLAPSCLLFSKVNPLVYPSTYCCRGVVGLHL